MRRALIVGINNYNDDITELEGCTADAMKMYEVLSTHEDGAQNFECMLLTNPSDEKTEQLYLNDPETVILEEEITTSTLKQYLCELFNNKADIALFYFAGHGSVTGLGGYLVGYDYESFNPGISMPELLTMANNANADEVILIIDSCHSGLFGSLPLIGNENAILREGVSILTGSAANQPALEDDGGGTFTKVVYDALNGVATDFLGRVTVASLYTYVEQMFTAWMQRPLYKSNVRKMVTLRNAEPPIPFAVLRKIPVYFETPGEKMLLGPEYEPSEKPKNNKKEKIFKDLQVMRNARLVIPEGAEHMYFAAINKKYCKLTPLGQYYWRLAKMKKFGIELQS